MKYMKDFKNDSTSVLERFGRDKRERTVKTATERVERRPRLQRDAADSEQSAPDRDSRKRASYNPHFTEDNRPAFGDRPRRAEDKPRYGDSPKRSFGDKPAYGDRSRRSGDRPAPGDRDRRYGDKPAYGDRAQRFGDKPAHDDRARRSGDKPYGDRDRKPGDRPAYGDRTRRFGDKPAYGEKSAYGDRDRKYGDKPAYAGGHKSDRPAYGDRKAGGKSYGDRDRAFGERRYGDRKPAAKFGSKPGARRSDKPVSYPKYNPEKQVGEMRLNRFIAQSGICSRREADDFITAGLVSVNGQVVTQLGTKVLPTDEVKFNDSRVEGEKKVYLVLNKPKGFVTSLDDPHATKTVMDLVRGACTERIYPVGRLDKNSLGLLLFTNDGDLTKQLTHPSYKKKKIYQVTLDKPLTRADMDKIAEGITLEDGEIFADEISYIKENKQEIGIEIHSGRNRIVRRIFEFLGYTVTKLDRVYYAGLTKKNLKRGAWRFLTREEVERLKSGQYE